MSIRKGRRVGDLVRATCKQCSQVELVRGCSAYFLCVSCKPANHYTRKPRYAAVNAVAQAKYHGVLLNPVGMACVDCGGPALVYDHRDYSRPIDVEPVCRPCNWARGSARIGDLMRSPEGKRWQSDMVPPPWFGVTEISEELMRLRPEWFRGRA